MQADLLRPGCRKCWVFRVLSGIMKRYLLLFLALFAAPVVFADTEVAEDTPAADTAAATRTVSEMLDGVTYLTKTKPKKKASVYFILRSHSKCGFCRKITPDLVAAYKAMKGKGAELILLSGDADTDVAKEWAKSAGMNYPIITNDTIAGVTVPSGGSGGFPNISVVTADGTVLEGASGASGCVGLVERWKDFVKDAKKAKKAQKSAAKKAAKASKKKAAANDAPEDSDVE